MEQSREERRQQRLRGAQRRQVKDVDFGLLVPVPVAATSVSAPSPLQQNATEEAPPTALQSLQTSDPSLTPTILTSARPRQSVSQSVNDANTSAKRRRLDSDLQVTSSGGRSTRSSRSQPRPDIYAIVDDEPAQPPALSVSEAAAVTSPGGLDNERILESQDSIDAVILESQATPSVHFADEPASLLESRTNLVDSVVPNTTDDTISRLEVAEVESEAQLTEVETPVPLKKRKRGAEPLRKSSRKSASSVEDDIDELSPQQPTRSVRVSKVAVNTTQDDEDRDPLSDPIEPEVAEEVDDVEATKILTKNRSKRKSINPAPEDENEEPVLPIPKRQRRRERLEANRTEQRQPKRAAPNKAQSAKKRFSGKPRLRAGSPIPVVVHRLTEGFLYEGDDPNIDILNSEIPHVKRAGVNSIDVLRQICQEIFGSALETLQEGRDSVDDAALRREYMTKWRAVNSFADEVYARLIEHTINLDNSHALQKRLKAETKRKLDLREEILRVRAEREQIALRMDEVRSQHELESAAASERMALNTSFHDIELAIDRGRQNDKSVDDSMNEGNVDLVRLEMQIKRVVELASSKGHGNSSGNGNGNGNGNEGGGGLLNQIKSFNAFLERSALVLETRRG